MGINGAFGGNGFGATTANANTAITRLIPPRVNAITRISTLKFTSGNTAHTITVLRNIGTKRKATAGAAANTAAITLNADPGPSSNGLGNSDWVAIRHSGADGVTRLYKTHASTGYNGTTGVMTLNASLSVAVSANDNVWMFGATTDTDPNTGEAHQTFATTANASVTLTDENCGIAAGNGKDEPLMLHDNNATAAGSLDLTSYCYTSN